MKNLGTKKQKEERMHTERREFLKKSAVGAAALSIPLLLDSSAIPSAASDERGKMVFQFLDFDSLQPSRYDGPAFHPELQSMRHHFDIEVVV